MRRVQMIAVNLNIEEKAYERVMYILNALPKQDVQIIEKKVIEEIDPTTLDKNDFDYISQEELDEIDRELAKAKANGFKDEL